jgi:hypothetical protein
LTRTTKRRRRGATRSSSEDSCAHTLRRDCAHILRRDCAHILRRDCARAVPAQVHRRAARLHAAREWHRVAPAE